MDSSKSNYVTQIEKRIVYIPAIFQGGFQSLLRHFANRGESVSLHDATARPLLTHHCKPNSSVAASPILVFFLPRVYVIGKTNTAIPSCIQCTAQLSWT